MSKLFLLHDDRTVQIERILPGPLERVWNYLTKAEYLQTWLAHGDVPQIVGGQVALSQQVEGVPIHTGAMICGTVTRIEIPSLLEYTWNHQTDTTNPSLVRFELEARGSEVLLRITHGQLRPTDQAQIATGWHTHTAILENRLRGEMPAPFLEMFSPTLKIFTAELEHQRSRLDHT
jgi:uncharacterized protein YndB with AHSA1/START domain